MTRLAAAAKATKASRVDRTLKKDIAQQTHVRVRVHKHVRGCTNMCVCRHSAQSHLSLERGFFSKGELIALHFCCAVWCGAVFVQQQKSSIYRT